MKYGWANIENRVNEEIIVHIQSHNMRIKHFSLTSATILRKFRFTLRKNSIIDLT